MFDKEFETIVLAPVNFAEIVAKTKRCANPMTSRDLEWSYTEAQAHGQKLCVFIVEFDPEE